MTQAWARDLAAITLFTDDLDESRDFYGSAFGWEVHFFDEDSVVFKVGGVLINLLAVRAAAELVEPAIPGLSGERPRAVMTVPVEDVEGTCAELRAAGVSLLNGPVDRPWGVRTASFADPSGHLWEIAAPLR